MKDWFKTLRIPKTILGIIIVIIGYYLDNKDLIKIGWSIITIGLSSKTLKTLQGNDPLSHEKHILNIKPKEK